MDELKHLTKPAPERSMSSSTSRLSLSASTTSDDTLLQIARADCLEAVVNSDRKLHAVLSASFVHAMDAPVCHAAEYGTWCERGKPSAIRMPLVDYLFRCDYAM
jgi:hypothetical protein